MARLHRDVGLLLCAGTLTLPVAARADNADLQRKIDELSEQGRALHAQAERQKLEAARQFDIDSNACYKNFFVSDCIASAKDRMNARQREAEIVNHQANVVDEETRRNKAELSQRRLSEDAAKRSIDEPRQIEKVREEEARRATRNGETQRKAPEEAARARRAAQQTAERERDAAEHAAKIDARLRARAEEDKRKALEQKAREAAEEAKRKQEAVEQEERKRPFMERLKSGAKEVGGNLGKLFRQGEGK